MDINTVIAPLLLKPSRINNYTHLIALLKLKQSKYKDFTHKSINHNFSKSLIEKNESFNTNNIIDGFLHAKLKDRFSELSENISSNFMQCINNKIKELKKENDQKIYSLRIGNILEIEDSLFNKPSRYTFKDDLLFDLYTYLNQRMEPLSFLENTYLKYIKNFMQSHGQINKNDNTIENPRAIKTMVSEFVRLRFNRDEFNIEVYEGRYLWAEVFILFRLGRFTLIKELLLEYEIFFEFMAQKFKSTFLNFIDNKKANFVISIGSSEDKFKKFMFELVDEKARSDGLVINSVEDYIWMKLIGCKTIKNDCDKFENPKIRFMICLLSKKYKKSIDVLLKSDFNLVAKFFLLKELCLEQALDLDTEGFSASANANRGKTAPAFQFEDSSASTFSMNSETSLRSVEFHNKGLSKINPIFFNFMFNIVSKLSSRENKVKFIEMLKHHSEYYNVVPSYIIKYSLFDVIGKTNKNEVDFYLDNEIASKVINKLMQSGNRNKLIQLHGLIPKDVMIKLLVDILEEAILVDERVDHRIVDEYVLKDCEKVDVLYSFYKFNSDPSISTLNETVVLDKNRDLREYKFIIEKLFSKIVEIIKQESNSEMAKTVFNLCGTLDLNENCCKKVARDLVMLI